MSDLAKLPWLALLLLLLVYYTFGWSYAEWTIWSIEVIKEFSWLREMRVDPTTIEIVGGVLLFSIVLVFTGAIAFITSKVINWVQTRLQVFTSVVGGALLVVVILCLFQYSVRFLVLLSATALLRLELRNAGFRKNQATIVSSVLCLSGFILGVLGFTFLGNNDTEVLSSTISTIFSPL
jgi:hypothetical protein